MPGGLLFDRLHEQLLVVFYSCFAMQARNFFIMLEKKLIFLPGTCN